MAELYYSICVVMNFTFRENGDFVMKNRKWYIKGKVKPAAGENFSKISNKNAIFKENLS